MASTKRRGDKDRGNLQVGAIPIRRKDSQIELFIVTSRTRRRWILPKGRRKRGESAYETCKREVLEEAGLKGKAVGQPIRTIVSSLASGKIAQNEVLFYLFEVTDELTQWKEMGQRERRAVDLEDALKFLDRDEYMTIVEHVETVQPD